MSILEALAKAKRGTESTERVMLPNGMLSIADDVFKFALQRLGVGDEIINDLMLEPVQDRGEWLEYYERNNK